MMLRCRHSPRANCWRPAKPKRHASMHVLLSSRQSWTPTLHRAAPPASRSRAGEAEVFLAGGGVGAPEWRQKAKAAHVAFIARNLSRRRGRRHRLAMALFVRTWSIGDDCGAALFGTGYASRDVPPNGGLCPRPRGFSRQRAKRLAATREHSSQPPARRLCTPIEPPRSSA